MTDCIDETFIDKSSWGPGPWQDEPDKREWVHGEFICQALRQKESGHWCGYVGVDKDHTLFGVNYDFEMLITDEFKNREIIEGRTSYIDIFLNMGCTEGYIQLGTLIDTHCGLTYANNFPKGEWDDYWFFGFDCAHADDFAPGALPDMVILFLLIDATDFHQGESRALGYVQREITKLAEQLEVMR